MQDTSNSLTSIISSTPFVAVIMPVLNEEKQIRDCLGSLVHQWPTERYEILVVDGGSSDATLSIVEDISRSHPFIRVISNPRRIQSSAVNIGAALASPKASIFVRADGHALYPEKFITTCVAALFETGAQSVVVPMRNQARPSNKLQSAIAFAQSSRLGNGGAAHRAPSSSGYVDHGHHAAFNRAFFRSLGGYDETFTHNEDAEFDARAIAAGGRVWMSAEAAITYFPRSTLASLARQYFQHGRGRARTVLKHRQRLKLRQMLPLALLAELLITSLLALISPAWLLIAMAYPLSCMCWAVLQGVRRRDLWLCLAGVVLPVMHLSWALGFMQVFNSAFFGYSAVEYPVIRPSAVNQAVTQLTI